MRVRFLSVAGLVTAALLLVPSFVPAQSLGELAEKEKERRKKEKAAKVYSEDDLRGSKGTLSVTGTVASSGAEEKKAEAGAASGAKKEKTEDEKRTEAQQAWRQKLDKANADVSRLQAEVDSLQLQLNDINVNLYSPGRTAALNRLEQAKTELAAAKQAVADLEEEGRRNGFR